MTAPFSPAEAARALGGRVVGKDKVRAPSPGMPPTDELLEIKFGSKYANGFTVNDYYGGNDDWQSLYDYVRDACGKPFEPSKPKDDPVQRMNARANGFSDAKPQAEKTTKKEKPKLGPIVKTYDYTEADGTLLYQVTRHDPKDFRQRMPDGKGGWIKDLDKLNGRRVLYRWPDLIKYPDATVFFNEGEKDADRLASLGHCATTVASGKWTPDCVEPLKDRHAFILEDNDIKGRKRALAAAKELHGVAASLRIVQLSNLPRLPDNGPDVSDWLNEDPSRADLLVDICLATPVWEPAQADEELSSDADEDDFPNAEKPPRFLFETTADLRSGEAEEYLIDLYVPERSTGLFWGKWGSFKTFAAFDWALHLAYGFKEWHGAKLPGEPCHVLVIAREGKKGFIKRIDAFKKHHNLTEDPEHLTFMRSAISFLDNAGFAELKKCIKDLKKTFRLVLVDTVGRVLPGEDMAKEQPITLFMERLQQVGEITGGASIGVHHENKSGDANGSMYFQNNSDFMFSVTRDGDKLAGKLTCVKQKDGEDQWSRKITLVKVDLEDGKSSLVVENVLEELAQPNPAETKKPRALKSEHKLALEALDAALIEEGRTTPVPDAPHGTRVVHKADWMDQLFRRGLLDKADRNRWRDFGRIWQALAARHLIAQRDDMFWKVREEELK